MGASEKLVDLVLPKSTAILVALALDGDPLACGSPCDEVYSNVSAIETGQHLMLGPAPGPVELEFRLLKRMRMKQLLELVPCPAMYPEGQRQGIGKGQGVNNEATLLVGLRQAPLVGWGHEQSRLAVPSCGIIGAP